MKIINKYINKIEKPWGYEIIFTPLGLPYVGKILHINTGKKLSLQYHDKKLETQYLLNGKCMRIEDDDSGQLKETEMKQNNGYTININQRHRLIAISDCEILEVSTPEIGNTYRLEDDYGRGTETEATRKELTNA